MNIPVPPKSSRDKVQAHRRRLREQGLRPIQIWAPNVRDPRFIAEARRPSQLVSNDPSQMDDQAFIDAVSVWDEM